MDWITMVSTLLALFSYFILKIAYQTLSFYWLTPRRIQKTMAKQGVCGPQPRFLTGNLPEMAALLSKAAGGGGEISHDIVPRVLPHYLLWSKIFGKRFIFWNGVEPRMCLTEPEMIKELLTKHTMVTGKSWQQQQGSRHFVGQGLLMANGQDWYHQRHIVQPALMGEKLKSFYGFMVESTKTILEALEKSLETGETEVEIGEYMTRLTADIISRTEFDTNFEKGKRIFEMLTNLQSLVARASRHLWFPGSRFLPSKYNREIKSMKKEVERQLMEIIQSRKDRVEVGRSSSYGNDMLGMLLEEMQKKRSDGFSLNLQIIMDECKTFFFAGHDTTARLLTWTLMLLATNPHWQEKVRAEVQDLCHGGPPSLDHLSKLSLLNMVINESLRLYPPATLLPRMAFEDIKLGDLHIPKGLSLWIPVIALHHSKEIWGDDANEFNPQRFASRSAGAGRHFLPFAAGPRNCVGQLFAQMEAKIILAMLLSKFSFAISQTYRHAPELVLILRPKYGVQLHVTKIQSQT
ncbi:cytokinin hydroxylase [Andrographis paniculata]|uniref:cytokinin hydroxylase n=1 Tax=Andrographis paniculata TaxID=175694 RepID=UPI0021E8F0E6|nr:cytokinin hydroxylase [Andrographis paniculata]